jgi:hypothetical protein
MLYINDLAQALGQNTWRTWRLIWALKPVMKALCVSGPGEPFVFKPEAVYLLRRAKALRESGISIKNLESALFEDIFNNDTLSVKDPSMN